ncbi:hypothetical protein ACXET9_07130 [Brachybacterium sp. DNPG3]
MTGLGRVDAGPTIGHLRVLTEAGVSLRRVAEVAGMDRSAVQRIANDSRRQAIVARRTEEKILAVTIEACEAAQPTAAPAGPVAPAAPAPAVVTGTYVALFPLHGGVSVPRMKRIAIQEVSEQLRGTGTRITSEWSWEVRGHGPDRVLLAWADAETTTPAADVATAAEAWAEAVAPSAPDLAAWARTHLPEAVAA